MLLSVVVRFEALEDFSLRGNGGEALHGLFFSLLEKVNPSISERWHELKGPKPFSLSGLKGEELRREGGRLVVPSGAEVWARVCTLTDEGAEVLCQVAELLLFSKGEALVLGGGKVRPSGVEVGGGSDWACSATYSGILSRSSPCRALSLRFLSPTAFRRGGMSYPLPDPEAVFGSLLQRWNSFSPVKLPPDISGEFKKVALARFSIRTELLEFGGFREVGFTGTVKYELSSLPEGARKMVSALASFAFFSGVGRRTAMGMGEVSPSPEGQSNPAGL